MNFRIYFLKLAARHPAWRFFISLIHSIIFFCFFFILYVLNILRVEIVVGLVFLVPPIIILTYTFLLRRFANPTKLEELLELKEERDKEKEIERAREKERKDKEREIARTREKEREIERAREREEEEKRIKDNYLDIGLGHKLPKTIEKIRNPITDKSIIKIEQGDERGAGGVTGYEFEFNEYYTEKYMPNLLHEIRKEVIDEFIEQEIVYPYWKDFIKKKYDRSILNADGKIKFGLIFFNHDYHHFVHPIIFRKLIEYFQENGWTLSEDIQKEKVIKTIPVITSQIIYQEVFYLHPPEK